MKKNKIQKLIVFVLMGVLLISAVSPAENTPAEKDTSKKEASDKSESDNNSSEMPDKVREINPPIPMSGWERSFMEWLGEHYPGYYNTMLRMENNKKGYQKNFRILKRRLGEIRNIHQRNPELGVAKMEELRLSRVCRGKLNAIEEAKDPKRKKELINRLEHYVKKQFEIKVLVSKLTHEELRDRIEKLSNDLAKREEELKKMIDNKDKEIDSQVKNLLKELEKCKKNK